MAERIELNEPDRVTVGTIGPVGERVFLLQAREEGRLVTMKVEKAQVSTLCGVLGRLLRSLETPEGTGEGGGDDLEGFLEPDFVVRTMRIGYDELADRVVLECGETPEPEESEPDSEDDGESEEGSVVQLSMTRSQALALAIRGTELVEAGRPACPRCGYPLDPRGHVCPKLNGNAPPLT